MEAQTVMAWSAVAQAGGTVAVGVLTFFLTRATNRYARDTGRLVKQGEINRMLAENRLRSAQAVQVSAWLESFHALTGPNRLNGTLAIFNGSDQPIYDVVVKMKHPNYGEEVSSKRVVPPRSTLKKTEWQFRLKKAKGAAPSAVQVGDIAITIEFFDAAGRRWTQIRHDSGILELLDEGPDF